MVLVLKKGDSKKDIEAIEKKLFNEKPRGGFNTKKYNETINLNEEPLTIQTKLRNE